MKTEKKNLRRISIVVTAQTKGNLERLATVCGYSEIGRVVDKLTREKMISLHDFERKEMSDILTTIAAVEWIVVGCLFLWRLRHWNRRFSELYDELRKEIDHE